MAEKKPPTKTQVLSSIAEETGLNKKEVQAVLDSLAGLIGANIAKKGAGVFTIPGLMKVKRVDKPARKAQKNVPNPFKPGETMDVAAKPASSTVKVLALKALKDMV
jgi:nucleoid DNA-binding protein